MGQREMPSRRPVADPGPGCAALLEPDPGRRHPGGRGQPARSHRWWTATSSTACSTSRTTSPHRWREADLDAAEALAGRRGDRRPLGANLRPHGRLGGPAPVDPAPRGAAGRHARTCGTSALTIATELRQLISYDNARVYRVQDATAVPGRVPGPRARSTGRRTPSALTVAVGEGITGLGRPLPCPPAGGRHRERPPRQSRSPAANPTRTSRCCSRPWSTRAPAWASSCWPSRACASSPRTTCACSSSTRRSPPRRWPTPTRRRACGSSPLPSSASCVPSASSCAITESILTTLDQRAVLEQITERLGSLIRCDNIAIEVVERPTGPAAAADRARGPRRALPRAVGTGRAGPRHLGRGAQRAGAGRGRAQRTSGSTTSATTGAIDGSLIVVPLIGPHGAVGVLTLERLGHRDAVRPAGVRAGPAVRRPGVDRAAQRRDVPGGRGARPDGRPDRPAQSRHVQGLARSSASSRAIRSGSS